MSSISLEMATIVAAFLEAFLYGIYIMLFGKTVQIMYNRPRASTSLALWSGIVLLFILSTMHIGVTIRRFVNAFIVLRNEPGGPTAYIADQTEWLSLFSLSIYGVSIFIGDCLVVWRCFIVWGKKWWIVFVFGFMICALEFCGISVMVQISRLTSAEDIFSTKITEWFEAFVILSMSNNLIVSGLIIYHLLRVSKAMGNSLGAHHGRRYRHLALVILESASIYPICMVIHLTVYRTGSQAHWTVNTIMVQILAITPCLMIYAVLTSKKEQSSMFMSTNGPSSRSSRWPSRFVVRSRSATDVEGSQAVVGYKGSELGLVNATIKVDAITTSTRDDTHEIYGSGSDISRPNSRT
ncbi:hypothetical protein ONZ45_g8456 [Pleurotus djamor]|nr:hypothetical protein ONZ45_g8456 [Pleurotus djamor]